MKKAIRLIVMMLTILMAVGTAIPVFADQEQPWATANEAKITIEETTVDHTYEAYQLFKGEYSKNSENVHVLSNIEWGDAVAEVLSTNISLGSNNTNSVEYFLLNYTLKNGRKLTTDGQPEGESNLPTTADGLANSLRHLNDEADIQGYTNHVFEVLKLAKTAIQGDSDKHIYFVESTGTPAVIDLTDSVKYVASNGDSANRQNYVNLHTKGKGEGYYLIKDKDGSMDGKVDDSYTRFIVRVAGSVKLSAKMSHPTVIKKVKENSNIGNIKNTDDKISNFTLGTNFNDTADLSSGETIEFEAIATVPSTIDGYKKLEYIFTDKMSKGLTSLGNPTVKLIDSSNKEYILSSGYTIIHTEHIEESTGELIDNHLQLTISDLKGEFKYKGSVNPSEQTLPAGSVKSGWFVKIEYKAKFSENAVIGGVGNPNEIELQYTNDPNGFNNGSYGKTVSDEVRVYTYQLDVLKQNAQAENNVHAKLPGAQFKLSRTIGDNTTWAKVENGFVTAWESLEANATALTTDENGKILIKGLDRGKYALKEIVAPTGFNLLASPVTFEITSSIGHGQNITDFNTAVTPSITVQSSVDIAGGKTSTNEGEVAMYVNNKTGAQLPVTGGMGTTVIYVAGFALVVFATLTLIVRKKTSK